MQPRGDSLRVHKSPPLVPILSDMNPTYTLPSHALMIHLFFFTVKRERRTPYGPIHDCLSVRPSRFPYGDRQPAWPGIHVGKHCCATMGRKVIFGTYCCATMTSDHISATITYMWREKYLWNVSVRQRVHLSCLVIFSSDLRLACIFQGVLSFWFRIYILYKFIILLHARYLPRTSQASWFYSTLLSCKIFKTIFSMVELIWSQMTY
jgi:hypothetical protein